MLTSFKTARLASALPYVDKVLFVVDRKDLDVELIAKGLRRGQQLHVFALSLHWRRKSVVFRDKVVQLLDGRDDDFIRMIAAFFVPLFSICLCNTLVEALLLTEPFSKRSCFFMV